MRKPVRVLVIDDSALMRKLIPRIVASDPRVEVVGTAPDGNFGLKKIAEFRPDVVTLDLEMPGMNGVETLKEIRRRWHLPVIVVSSHSTDAAITIQALTLGAFDFVAKPANVAERMPEIAAELLGKIHAAAQSGTGPLISVAETGKRSARQEELASPTRVIAMGISTGGPNALQYLFSQLPGEFAGTILVVQHMPDGFTELFAKRLDDSSSIQVKEARSGDLLLAGRALICPGNRHMRVKRLPFGDVVVLSGEEPVNGHRPSADVLFYSVAQYFGAQAVGVLMTGMGEDGAEGMGAMQRAGGLTVAQSRETCVVFGMPRAAIERGYATRIADLQALPRLLQECCATDERERKDRGKATSTGSN